MEEDLFDYIITPTAKEYRKINIIDKIAWIPKLKIKNHKLVKEQFINDAIINYNNEVIMVKTFYANMLKYRKYFQKKKSKEFDIWTRKYAEQVIKELFAIYDKSYHIINYLYNFKIAHNNFFNENVRKKLKSVDKDFYDELLDIFEDTSKNNKIRNNITHNFSDLFLKYNPKYNDNIIIEWEEMKLYTYDEYKKLIDDICMLLAKHRDLIVNKIAEFYPNK